MALRVRIPARDSASVLSTLCIIWKFLPTIIEKLEFPYFYLFFIHVKCRRYFLGNSSNRLLPFNGKQKPKLRTDPLEAFYKVMKDTLAAVYL